MRKIEYVNRMHQGLDVFLGLTISFFIGRVECEKYFFTVKKKGTGKNTCRFFRE